MNSTEALDYTFRNCVTAVLLKSVSLHFCFISDVTKHFSLYYEASPMSYKENPL